MERGQNLHHVFYERRLFNANRSTSQLRNDERTHVILPIPIHNELHSFCESLTAEPLLARVALSRINSQPNSYKAVDRISDLSDFLTEHDTGEAWARGLRDQLPFLILGTKSLRRKIIL